MAKKLPNLDILRRVIDNIQSKHSLMNKIKTLQKENTILKEQLEETNQQLFTERAYYIEQIGNHLGALPTDSPKLLAIDLMLRGN